MTSEFEFNGETYRDDRMFVMNIATATMAKDNKKCWNLATYRNTISLPATRNDFFDTKKELIDYVKLVEPQTPLISRFGEYLETPSDIDKDKIEEIWDFYNKWLNENGMFSALSGISHVPYFLNKKGYERKTFHATHEVIKY
tara:strand:- start:981 stop:1406 length:426 start_codon:yes stop_codon:yes gene_type:complete